MIHYAHVRGNISIKGKKMEVVPYDPTDWEGVEVPKFRCVERAWKFLRRRGFRRLPANVETVFLRSPAKAVDYAKRVRSRLPKQYEDLIMKDSPNLAYTYVRDIIETPYPEYVKHFQNDAKLLVQYAFEVLKGPLPEHLEMCLIGDPYSCFEYSWQILDGRLPETLHNYMFGAMMDDKFSGNRYRGCPSKLDGYHEYSPDYSNPKEYFEFIKWQRKNLHRLMLHYAKMYNVDTGKSVQELLHELEHGR
jgi:hypothetical protein